MRANNINYIVEQKFRLRQLQRPYTIQAEPSFLLLDQKEDKRRRLCSQPGYSTPIIHTMHWSSLCRGLLLGCLTCGGSGCGHTRG